MDYQNNNKLPKNILDKRLRQGEIYKSYTENTSELIKEYADYLYYSENIKNVSIKTANKYIRIFLDFIDYLDLNKEKLEASDLEFIGVNNLNDFIKFYNVGTKDETNKYYMNQPGTINIHISGLKKFFKWAYNKEYIDKNPSLKLETQNTQTDNRITILEDDEIEAIYNLLDYGKTIHENDEISLSKKQMEWHQKQKLRDKALFTIMLYNGLRIEEVHYLNLDFFNFNKMEFTVYRKRNKVQTMYLNEFTKDVILEYIKNERPESDDSALFLSKHGSVINRLSIKQMRRIIKKYMKLVNPHKKLSPHKLRATCATKIIELYNDIYSAQKILGHASPETTQRYAKASEKRKKEISQNIKF